MLPIQRPKLVDVIVDQILEAARSGEIGIGERLPSERELIARLGVSRGSLREACKKLESIGALSIRQGDGTYLNGLPADYLLRRKIEDLFPVDGGSVLELLEVRQIIEVQAAALATERAHARDVKDIGACVRAMKETIGDAESYRRADFEFHQNVVRAAKNRILDRIFASICDLVMQQVSQAVDLPGGPSLKSLRDHQQIFEAIRDKDLEKASRHMRQHLEAIPRRLIANAREKSGDAG